LKRRILSKKETQGRILNLSFPHPDQKQTQRAVRERFLHSIQPAPVNRSGTEIQVVCRHQTAVAYNFASLAGYNGKEPI